MKDLKFFVFVILITSMLEAQSARETARSREYSMPFVGLITRQVNAAWAKAGKSWQITEGEVVEHLSSDGKISSIYGHFNMRCTVSHDVPVNLIFSGQSEASVDLRKKLNTEQGLYQVENVDHAVAWVMSQDGPTQAKLLSMVMPWVAGACLASQDKISEIGYHIATSLWLSPDENFYNLSLVRITPKRFEELK